VHPGVPEVIFFHTVSIQQYGGAEGVREPEALEAAVVRPWFRVGAEDTFPSPFDKAAAICESIIRRHPFVDGNKRTGVSAGAYLLSTFGFEVDAPLNELEDLAIGVAKGEMSLEDIAAWFETYARKAS